MVGPLVNDPTLASVRAIFERDMVDSCVRKRITAPVNGALGHKPGTRAALDPVKCKYGPPGAGRNTQSGAEEVAAGGVEIVVVGVVKLPANTDVQQSDILEVTIAETGVVLDLDPVYIETKSREFTRKVYCKLVDPGEI